ncbi:DUF3889 domain-containing protein [Ureibacillus aquaedulcis]|uniref:DUF3889 domain-containing protein n=1 Tax=Ureibacillus aquaedulcis TaxID=3058421 RepID=A0ABT8GPU8_9BACL|nr:DUF3889 domain-containing protein [Ureibacillus sp. BA0131]MDN4493446.1 DUF3889 domain-containing protein [Ureibacillus sp. BA0131]
MKTKIAVSVLLVFSTIALGKILTEPPEGEMASAEQVAPSYAKWGRVAMKNVMAKYPTADIIDYLHIGREVGSVTSVEKFKLWLKKEDSSEFGVFVDITFNNQTEEIVDIKYTETNQ